MRIGACDICNAQDVELSRSELAGLETWSCTEGCLKSEAAKTNQPETPQMFVKPMTPQRTDMVCNWAGTSTPCEYPNCFCLQAATRLGRPVECDREWWCGKCAGSAPAVRCPEFCEICGAPHLIPVMVPRIQPKESTVADGWLPDGSWKP